MNKRYHIYLFRKRLSGILLDPRDVFSDNYLVFQRIIIFILY